MKIARHGLDMNSNMLQRLKQVIPWWMKIGAKLIIKRIPYPYIWSQKIGLFRLGHMLNFKYALDTFLLHYEQAKPYLPSAFTALELGPGDSLASAMIAAAFGSQHTWLVDVGSFAARDIRSYNQFSFELAERKLIPAARTYADLADLLRQTGADYLLEGVKSLKALPDNSVNFAFSQAVLEHLPIETAPEILRELQRIQVPGGIASHRIDLKDHLAGSLHSLRFSKKIWESKNFRTSGFYTNRLRASQWKTLFKAAGYQVLFQWNETFSALPLPRMKLQPEFALMPEEELRISSTHFVVQK
jgi:SAM-dependent methyltransferase